MSSNVLPADLTDRIAQLKVRATALAEGALTGAHRSHHRGQSVEFSQHKEYAPGDEIRHLDWKALAKFDKYYVKQFEQESNLTAWLAVDASGSMGYRSGDQSKLEVGATLAAALAYLLIRQQDSVGLVLVGEEDVDLIPPRASPGHLTVLFDALGRLAPAGPTRLKALADALAETCKPRSLLFVFSDLFDLDPLGISRLVQLRHLKLDLSIVQVLDPDELNFPFEGSTLFASMEDAREVVSRPGEIRQSYLREIDSFLADVQVTCRASEVHHQRVACGDPLDVVLREFLAQRSRSSAGRRAR